MATILIVEDDKHTRALLQRILTGDPRLEGREVRVVEAADGEAGLAAFDRERPRLVITDLLMPRMDGFRFCEGLRRHPAGKDVELLVMSGVYRDRNVSERVHDQFRGRLYTKPYQLRELVDAVCTALLAETPAPAPARATTSDGGPLRGGALADTPLPQILLDLHEEKATGTLELRRGKVEKRVDWVVGYPVSVTSNQRSEALGPFLVARGVITEAQHQQALERARDQDEKLGEALQAQGALSAPELARHLAAQTRHKLSSTLRWSDGMWAFRPNRALLEGTPGNVVDPVAVVLIGLKRTAQMDEAARRVTALLGKTLKLTPRGERVATGIARAFGALLVDELRDGAMVDRLLAEPFEPAQAIPALEALLASGCIAATDDADAADTIEVEPLDPFALDELSEALEGQSTGPVAVPVGNVPPLPAPFDFDRHHSVVAGSRGEPRASRASKVPTPSAAEGADALLYDALFGEQEITGVEAVAGGGVPEPIEIADSSVVQVGRLMGGDLTSPRRARHTGPDDAITHLSGPVRGVPARESDETARAREAILAEHLRVRGRDWYAVLGVERDASADAISAAAARLRERISLERFAHLDLGADYAKLEEVVGAIRRAAETLGDPAQRQAYDRTLAGSATASDPGMTAELDYREGERRLAAGQLTPAVAAFRRAVAEAPDVADYHAGLAWALHVLGREDGVVEGDRGAAHLAQALAIDPDHAAAHEYAGRVLVEQGGDPVAAAAHLERALDAQPPRLGALPALEQLRRARGEMRQVERRYRKLIHAAQHAADPAAALPLWLALGRIYRDDLRDVEAARTAYHCALRLAPVDPTALAMLSELAAEDPARFGERVELLRTRWRLDPTEAAPGRALFESALRHGGGELAYFAAGALLVRGDDLLPQAAELHGQRRPEVPSSGDLRTVLDGVRHGDDERDLGELIAIVEPAAQVIVPLTLAELEVGPSEPVAEERLPTPIARVRDEVAALLGVVTPAVVRCAEFGDQIHCAGLSPPVLLAGPTALASEDALDLAFRVARAMSYLWPGRAFGGSRPGRVLREVVTGIMEAAIAGSRADDPSGRIAKIRRVAAGLPAAARDRLFSIARRMASERTNVNMSRWARGLGHTADRIGLLVCGDLVTAARAMSGFAPQESIDDLIDFALSPAHLEARAKLGWA